MLLQCQNYCILGSSSSLTVYNWLQGCPVGEDDWLVDLPYVTGYVGAHEQDLQEDCGEKKLCI